MRVVMPSHNTFRHKSAEKLQAPPNIVKFASFCVHFCERKIMKYWRDWGEKLISKPEKCELPRALTWLYHGSQYFEDVFGKLFITDCTLKGNEIISPGHYRVVPKNCCCNVRLAFSACV